jgi:hypothetical protein
MERKAEETMGSEKGDRLIRVDELKKGFFWFLMLAGIVLMVYFTLTLIINMVYAADLAGGGVNVVLEEPVFEDGNLVKEAEAVALHGVSGWVAAFSPWLATNAYYLALGAIFFAIGYVLTPMREEKLAVSLFKMRILGWYLVLVVLIMLILGVDRVFFLPHEAKTEVLAWIDWYIFEFLAHLVWAVVIAILAMFFLRVRRKKQTTD